MVSCYNLATFLPKRIAEELNRSPASISRELRRNIGKRGYRPQQMLLNEDEIQTVVDKLNHRPRKTRGYKTPYELFTGQQGIVIAA